MKRLIDLFLSINVLIIALPLLVLIAFAIKIDSSGGVFYRQIRVGRNGKEFKLFKFRTMKSMADKLGQLTVGDRDPRVTRIGVILRKSKLDELPQLINILQGEMSWVGPRPEVPKYVALYNSEQRKVLDVRPGLTDLASLEYIEESELLANSSDPEKTYISEILPRKLELQLLYIQDQSLSTDLSVMWKTFIRILQTLVR